MIARDKMDPGQVGVSLSYALNVTGAMNLLVRMTSEVETNMVSVERIQEYQEITTVIFRFCLSYQTLSFGNKSFIPCQVVKSV